MPSTSWDLRDRSADLLHRWASWWRVVAAWRGVPVAQRFVAVCAYCARVRVPGGSWEEIPNFVSRRFRLSSGPQVTHSVCPGCLTKIDRFDSQPPSEPR